MLLGLIAQATLNSWLLPTSLIIGGLGEWVRPCGCPPNREIDFAFVSCSCRACERAGEAKLRGRVRGVPPQRWASGFEILRRLAGTFRVKVAAIRVGFKRLSVGNV